MTPFRSLSLAPTSGAYLRCSMLGRISRPSVQAVSESVDGPRVMLQNAV